ncbi:DUF4249 domain-containing protein [Maribacter sp. 2308TA10-17]|uniref:DUF4249 domain-containing protein n=1 Tax=Maribacter sp. 2308TA10-17 TaxID=3386276 RepID=UPI0039BCA747
MKKSFYFILSFYCFQGCVEPFDAETQVFENALVIDARLTDEFKRHQVLLTRARPFEQNAIDVERNAIVKIIEEMGVVHDFEEVEPGKYVSKNVFNAKENNKYRLEVMTTDGKSYTSEIVIAPEKVAIENLYVEREINDFGEEGVSIFLDSKSSTSDAKYFRYEFKETYKIIAPTWDPFEFEVIDREPCADGDAYEVGIKVKEEQNRVCFGSALSKNVIQASTKGLEDSEIFRFPVHFLKSDNYIISHRYSILVRQHSQTLDAFSYYQNLNDFTSSESVFSETQPGFLAGNITSSEADENVIGYFEVSSVSQERIYFNYEDLFPNEPLPPYAVNCSSFGSPLLITEGFVCDLENGVCAGSCESPLISAIDADIISYVGTNEDYIESDFSLGPYFTKLAECGDCTKLGSNVKPDFWVD